MLGTIGFKGYLVNCIIGTEPHERAAPQNLFIDLKVKINFADVALSGKLEDTVNYLSLAHVCKDVALKGEYLLIEKYAVDILDELFKLFPLKSAWVRVKKPAALPDAEYTLVEFERNK